MYFGTKSYLKSNRNHTAKQTQAGYYFAFHNPETTRFHKA